MFGPLMLYDVINNCATLAVKTPNPPETMLERENTSAYSAAAPAAPPNI